MRAYVINMAAATARMEKFRTQNAWLAAERFDAIDGRRCDSPVTYRPPHRGSLASHVELWTRVASWGDGGPPAMICEDDAVVLEADYEREIAADDTLLLCGFNWDAPLAISYGLGPVVIRHDQETLRRVLTDGLGASQERLLTWPLIHCFGMPCYIVTPLGARRLLTEALPIAEGYVNMPILGYSCANYGIDCQLNIHYARLGARVLFPPRAFTPNIRD